MPRPRSTGVLLLTLVVGMLAATVVSIIMTQFVAPSSVVYKVLLDGFVYDAGPFTLNLVMLTFTMGFGIKINLLTILGLIAAYYYWKTRT